MKLHVKWLAVIVCLALPLAAVAAPPATCKAHGEAAFKAWTRGHDRKAGKHFSLAVSEKLTPAKLRKYWHMLQTRLGAFQKLGKFEPTTLHGHKLMVAPIDFAKARLAAVFTCDAKGHLTSMAVADPTKVQGLLPSPSPAAQADSGH